MTRRARPLMIFALLAVFACLWPTVTQAYPEPAIVPTSWDLNFTHGKPRPIAVRDVAGDMKWYWYMTYKVVNQTGEDQLFVPEVEIATDAGDIIRSGQNVPSAVFFAIKDKERSNFLESPNQIVGRLLQGSDFARESVVIWPAPDHDVDQVSIFIAGLSGESTTIKNPLTNEPVIVRKVYMLTYNFPGDSLTTNPTQQAVLEEDTQWIMR